MHLLPPSYLQLLPPLSPSPNSLEHARSPESRGGLRPRPGKGEGRTLSQRLLLVRHGLVLGLHERLLELSRLNELKSHGMLDVFQQVSIRLFEASIHVSSASRGEEGESVSGNLHLVFDSKLHAGTRILDLLPLFLQRFVEPLSLFADVCFQGYILTLLFRLLLQPHVNPTTQVAAQI